MQFALDLRCLLGERELHGHRYFLTTHVLSEHKQTIADYLQVGQEVKEMMVQ